MGMWGHVGGVGWGQVGHGEVGAQMGTWGQVEIWGGDTDGDRWEVWGGDIWGHGAV